MIKVAKKIKLRINASNAGSQIEKIIQQLGIRLKPVVDYYNRLNEREKQILFFGFIFVILIFFYFIVSAAYNFQNSLKNDYMIVQNYKADAEYLGKIYKDISQLTPNEFSEVSVDQIKGDFAAIAKNPDVQQISDTLTISISHAKFSDVMNVINQLRKSYGIFPSKLKITRLSESGYVSFRASFKVNIQNE